jgi:hypothetical protein
MKTHELKTVNPYFEDILFDRKRFEVRLNDRNYEVGDICILKEYDTELELYTGLEIKICITYIFKKETHLKKNYVVFQFIVIQKIIPFDDEYETFP